MVTRGKKHTFVGIDIEFNANGTVILSMDDYIDECINIYNDEINKSASFPAKGTLFDDNVGQKTEILNESKAEKFHHTTAKLFYVSKRVRIDIDLTVSYLCTRVASPTEGDEDKLRRVLSYLQGTKRMKRIIGLNGLSCIQTWTTKVQ